MRNSMLRKYNKEKSGNDLAIYEIALFARILVLAVFLGTTIFLDLFCNSDLGIDYSSFYFLIVIGVIEVAVSTFWMGEITKSSVLPPSQILALSCSLTLLIYITGLSVSPLIFLYIPFVMLVGIATDRKTALLASLISAVMFCYLGSFQSFGHMQLLDAAYDIIPLSLNAVLMKTLGLISGMSLISVATTYLTEKIYQKDSIIEDSEKAISEESRWRQVMEEVVLDGLVVLNSGGIKDINKTAIDILDLDKSEIKDLTTDEFFKDIFPDLSHLRNYFFKLSGQNLFSKAPKKYNLKDKVVRVKAKPIVTEKEGKVIVINISDITSLVNTEEKLANHEKYLKIKQENARSIAKISDSEIKKKIIGDSTQIKKLITLIKQISTSESTILLRGESGTGKELVAEAIHTSSSRRDKNFVAVNCGAIPESLIESQLFGHVKGAFTGAVSNHLGFFREANGGTLFLDEIGELPINMQTRLLRTLQEGTVRPVGSDKDVVVNVRIIAATHRDIEKLVKDKEFREDLFYRLNVITVKTPTLRERKNDIPLLVNHFLEKISPDNGGVGEIGIKFLDSLMSYDYPGNVRELRNLLERSIVIGEDEVVKGITRDLTKNSSSISERKETSIIEVEEDFTFPVDLDTHLSFVEQSYLDRAIELSEGDRKEAAKMLGINQRSLRYRIAKYTKKKKSEVSKVDFNEASKDTLELG